MSTRIFSKSKLLIFKIQCDQFGEQKFFVEREWRGGEAWGERRVEVRNGRRCSGVKLWRKEREREREGGEGGRIFFF